MLCGRNVCICKKKKKLKEQQNESLKPNLYHRVNELVSGLDKEDKHVEHKRTEERPKVLS